MIVRRNQRRGRSGCRGRCQEGVRWIVVLPVLVMLLGCVCYGGDHELLVQGNLYDQDGKSL